MPQPLFNFSPRFPWSGDVNQDIEPRVNWFFSGIAPQAGVASLERHIALDVASYGKQLSALTDVVQALLASPAASKVPSAVRQRFDELRGKIEQAKHDQRADYAQAAERALERLQAADANAYRRLLAGLQTAP